MASTVFQLLSSSHAVILCDVLLRRAELNVIRSNQLTLGQLAEIPTAEIRVLLSIYARHKPRLESYLVEALTRLEALAMLSAPVDAASARRRNETKKLLSETAVTCFDAILVIAREISDAEAIVKTRECVRSM